ncbi:hypothetical protein BTHE68_55640 [Burkholderia sp. THE68]|nr:hypothetical protein BTHE68_55640 [Burkholderia sp. THE68]
MVRGPNLSIQFSLGNSCASSVTAFTLPAEIGARRYHLTVADTRRAAPAPLRLFHPKFHTQSFDMQSLEAWR